MAEGLYFIKTNPVVAKINLYNKLCRKEDHILTFLDINKTSLETVKDKIKEGIESLTGEELLQLFSWFNDQYSPDHEEVKTQLFINGIDLFYELLSKETIQDFQQILADYEKSSGKTLSYISDSENFNNFLIYGIFYTGMGKKEENNILSDLLQKDHQALYSLAENQFQLNPAQGTESPEIQKHFAELYDSTKFYKGSVIKLHTR